MEKIIGQKGDHDRTAPGFCIIAEGEQILVGSPYLSQCQSDGRNPGSAPGEESHRLQNETAKRILQAAGPSPVLHHPADQRNQRTITSSSFGFRVPGKVFRFCDPNFQLRTDGEVIMAHKKGQGSSRNGRDSAGQRLGVKRFGGQLGQGRIHSGPPARHQNSSGKKCRPRQGLHPFCQDHGNRHVRTSGQRTQTRQRVRPPGSRRSGLTFGVRLDFEPAALRGFYPSNLSMKQKSSSKAETEETAASAFAVKNMFPAEAPTAATGEKAGT